MTLEEIAMQLELPIDGDVVTGSSKVVEPAALYYHFLGRLPIKPVTASMKHYDTTLAYPVQSPGVLGNQPDIVMDNLVVHGLGFVHLEMVFNFYNEFLAYLALCGVDGVKVDVQNIIENTVVEYLLPAIVFRPLKPQFLETSQAMDA
ncbi:hypothetical protein J1N35_005073 [Gossypium stocksii]|uniref:Uncharacterized protein n=1 Tax=Gossypium stocksii TaxID=47602 RepID=A0A9D3WES7_9ROSI|nr:hypothetical protein J1N35_005073 [Gossypium stocksii]